jgi:hypothetical protein
VNTRTRPPAAPRMAAAPASERAWQHTRIVAALQAQPTSIPAPASQSRLATLAERFGLAPLESDLLALLWVGAFEPELRAEAASRETCVGQITARLVSQLFGHPRRVRLNSESPLLAWGMVQEHGLIDGSAALAIDPTIVAWLEGEHELDRALAGRVALLDVGVESPHWGLDALTARLREGLQRGTRWQLRLHTDDALAAAWCAAAVGRRMGLPVLAARPGALTQDGDTAVRLQRQCFLDGCIPFVAADEAVLARPPGVLPYPLCIVHGAGAMAALADGTSVLALELPPPDAEHRHTLWRTLWPEVQAWPERELADLALCHEAGAGDIAAAASSAPQNAAEAALRLRERSRADVGTLAQRIDGGFGWDDLVLPEATHARLHEIAFEARERARVWADPAAARLFPYGRGLVALFAGPPGTGKTMAAQVIAQDLGLDLLAVDLSAVVSKWVGETAQHLQQLLASRAAQRAVLFFDEADALYAKRVEEVRDAQDRYANLDTSHLMTALENYPGIVLLASNLKANIDAAFLRRIRHVVEFPKPDAEARLRIWQQVLAGLFGNDAPRRLGSELGRLAGIEATGAVIKNAALSALFRARHAERSVDLRLLGEMLARELAKEGAGLSARELDAVVRPCP